MIYITHLFILMIVLLSYFLLNSINIVNITLYGRTSQYVNKLHMRVHYGPNWYMALDDSTMNDIKTTGLSQKQNSQLMF